MVPCLYLSNALMLSCYVMSDSLRPHVLKPTRFLYPWDFPGKNTRVGCHFLFQGILPTQGSHLGLLHWQADFLPLSHQGSPYYNFFNSSGLETHPKGFDKCMKGIPCMIFQFVCPLIILDPSELKLKAKEKVSSLTTELVSKKLMYPFMIMCIGWFNTQLSHSPSKILFD